MTVADWQPFFQALIGLCAAVITGLGAIYIPRAIAAYEAATGVQVTAQDRAAVYAAADTAANLLRAQVDRGLLDLAHATSPDSPAVIEHAKAAIERVADSAATQNTTPQAMQEIIAGRVAGTPQVDVAAMPVRRPLPPELILPPRGTTP